MKKIATTTAAKRREALAALYFCLSLLMLTGEPYGDVSILIIIIYYGATIINFFNAIRVVNKYISIKGND